MEFEIYEEIDEFLERQSDKTRKLIIKKLRLFNAREKRVLERSGDVKWLDQKVYEVVIGPWRLLGWLVNTTLHITVIFRKKSNKTPQHHINTAANRGREIEAAQ